MGLIGLLLKNPAAFLMLAVPLMYSIIFHEIAHGWVASLFGDDTAKKAGRLTLNPVSHLDLFGTLALFLIGFGWAKPVPVNFRKIKNLRLGLICVSLAGCFANILIATGALFLVHNKGIQSNSMFAAVLVIVARINIILGAFNLIPIPPLDGSRILLAVLPKEAQRVLIKIEPYGFGIIIFLIMSGILSPIIGFVQHVILSLISIVL